MEITLNYNPFDKKFRIYKGQKLITETTSLDVSYNTFILYKNKSDIVMNRVEEMFDEMWDLELEIAEGVSE